MIGRYYMRVCVRCMIPNTTVIASASINPVIDWTALGEPGMTGNSAVGTIANEHPMANYAFYNTNS